MTSVPPWRGEQRILLVNGIIHSPIAPFATAMLIDGDTIAWLGDDGAAAAHRDSAQLVLDLGGRLVTPGFVDSHVHSTSTGLALTGIDLSEAASLAQALDLIESAVRSSPEGPVIGHGWDDSRWPEGRPFTRLELDRATGGAIAYISRIDVHSAVVSTALIDNVPAARATDGYRDSGHVTRAAHHVLREYALQGIGAALGERAQRALRQRCAELGIVAIHEMAGPVISSATDAQALISLADHEPGPLVTVYWGELAKDGGVERARDIGAVGAGGDLFIDGSIGSHTACLREPYLDAGNDSGAQYLTSHDVRQHVLESMDAGMQAGFHVIGDRAADIIVEAFRDIASERGTGAMRAAQHRLEHAEMLSDGHLDTLAELGITASVQPMFDALWAGPGGMYERRLGAHRAGAMNRFASMTSRGIPVAYGSDAPVTELGPWAAMRAAMYHHNPDERVTARAAFTAHTRGGWRAIGRPDTGTLAPGSAAHYAVWDAESLTVQTPDDRLAGWSTDPRSGTPGLPDLGPDLPMPSAVRTVVAGRTIFDIGAFE